MNVCVTLAHKWPPTGPTHNSYSVVLRSFGCILHLLCMFLWLGFSRFQCGGVLAANIVVSNNPQNTNVLSSSNDCILCKRAVTVIRFLQQLKPQFIKCCSPSSSPTKIDHLAKMVAHCLIKFPKKRERERKWSQRAQKKQHQIMFISCGFASWNGTNLHNSRILFQRANRKISILILIAEISFNCNKWDYFSCKQLCMFGVFVFALLPVVNLIPDVVHWAVRGNPTIASISTATINHKRDVKKAHAPEEKKTRTTNNFRILLLETGKIETANKLGNVLLLF